MANPFVISRRYVGSGEWSATVSVDAAPGAVVTVALGAYFNDASVASASLAAALQSALNTTLAPETFTVTWSTTTGKFTITCTSGTITTWTWGQTEFRDWMGFTGNMAGAAAFTGQNVAQGVVFAGSGRAKDTGLLAEKTGSTVVAEDGSPVRIGTISTRRKRSFQFEFEPPAAVASPLASGTDDEAGTVVPWTWFDFWEFHSRTGNPFRYYTAAGAAIGSFESAYFLENVDDFEKTPTVPGSTIWWTFRLVVRVFTIA